MMVDRYFSCDFFESSDTELWLFESRDSDIIVANQQQPQQHSVLHPAPQSRAAVALHQRQTLEMKFGERWRT